MGKIIQEINKKIRSGSVAVFNAEEIIHVVRENGIKLGSREMVSSR